MKIHRFPVTTSTNDEAIRRAREGASEGEVFTADKQTAGRGRLGRLWESPAGKNVYASFLLRPPLSPAGAVILTLAGGIAALETLKKTAPAVSEQLKIKWPNDVYLGEKKIAGVLTEMEAEGQKVRWVVCGIGMDLNSVPEDFSPEVRKIATSLRIAMARDFDRDLVTQTLIKSFERRYLEVLEKGPSSLLQFCSRHSYLNGKQVRADGIEGTAVGLDPEGFLQVKTDAGLRTVIAGDVSVL